MKTYRIAIPSGNLCHIIQLDGLVSSRSITKLSGAVSLILLTESSCLEDMSQYFMLADEDGNILSDEHGVIIVDA